MPHDKVRDHECRRCKMMIMTGIIHECDPSICISCNGDKQVFVGRENKEWVGFRMCEPCQGTGLTIWKEENPIGVA